MDKLSIIGLVLAVSSLIGGSVLKGAGLAGLWSPAAFVIVILGTIAATIIQARMDTVKRSAKIVKWVFKAPTIDRATIVEQIIDWSKASRKEGILALQPQIDVITDPFLQRGLQMVVDGMEPDAIREAMELEVHNTTEDDLAAAKVFESAGIYSPTMGIIGAVLGLMAVMKNLSEPDKIGAGIAAAFTATIYGIGLANLVLLPFAGKLKSLINQRADDRQMAIEGLIGIASAENPQALRGRLNAYISQ